MRIYTVIGVTEIMVTLIVTLVIIFYLGTLLF